MRIVTAVINKARNRLQFDNECRPDSLARQSLLECCDEVKKLEDINVDKAVDVFETKWNEKVCCLFAYFLVISMWRFGLFLTCCILCASGNSAVPFSVAAPKAWNELPDWLRNRQSVDSFKAALKTFLFNL